MTTCEAAQHIVHTVVGDGFREAGDGRRGLWRVATAKGDGGDGFPRRAARIHTCAVRTHSWEARTHTYVTRRHTHAACIHSVPLVPQGRR
jgi:hypothetical protein